MLYPYTITGIWKIMEDHLKNREIRNKTVLIQTGWDIDARLTEQDQFTQSYWVQGF